MSHDDDIASLVALLARGREALARIDTRGEALLVRVERVLSAEYVAPQRGSWQAEPRPDPTMATLRRHLRK